MQIIKYLKKKKKRKRKSNLLKFKIIIVNYSIILIIDINSFMMARAAQSNPSIFRREGLLPKLDIIKEYSRLCARYDMPYQNAKYSLLCIWGDHQDKIGFGLVKSKSVHDIWYANNKFLL